MIKKDKLLDPLLANRKIYVDLPRDSKRLLINPNNEVNLPHQDDTSLDRKESTDSEDLEHTARRLFQGLVTPAERQKLQRRLGQDPDFRRAYHKVRRERSLLRNTWTFIKNATKAPFSRSRKASKFLSPRRLRFLFGSVKKKRK